MSQRSTAVGLHKQKDGVVISGVKLLLAQEIYQIVSKNAFDLTAPERTQT